MSAVWKINNTTIKSPKDFDIEEYNLTKSGRLASGLMCMDFIAKKRKFPFRYDVISGTDLDIILGLISTSTMFFTLSYVENGTTKTASCYTGAIKRKKFRTDGVWYWKDVSFDLIER